MASTISIKLLKRGRIGQCKKALSPLFSNYSSIYISSTSELTKDINNTNNIDINTNQRYYSTYTPPPNNKYHGTQLI